MKLQRVVALGMVSSLIAASSPGTEDEANWDAVARIREEGFRHSRVMDTAGYLTDVLGPRLAGSTNLTKAQEWTATKLEELGLSNVALETFGEPVPSWQVEYNSIHMLAPDYQMIIGYPRAFTPGTKGKIVRRALIAEVRTKSDLDRYRGKLADAIVLIEPEKPTPPRFTPEAWRHDAVSLANIWGFGQQPERPKEHEEDPETLSFEERLAFFRAQDAAVLLEPGGSDNGTVLVDGRPRREDRSPVPLSELLPILTVAAEHYNRIHRLLERGIPVELEVEVRTSSSDGEVMRRNVIGEIPGSDLKDQVVMIGGHLDSWHAGTGATDDAAGCAAAMEAMRILRAVGLKPRRTIRIALWDHEEGGLHGSRAYVQEHFGDPRTETKPAYDKFSGYFNMDVGSGQFRGVFLQEIDAVGPIFEEWMKPFHDLGMEKLTRQNTGGSDHLAFTEAGLPGWQFIQDELNYENRIVHSNMDVYDKLVERDLMTNAVILASFAFHAAMREERLPRKPLEEEGH